MEFPTDAKFSNLQMSDISADLLTFRRLNPAFSDQNGGDKYLVDDVLLKNSVTEKYELNSIFMPKDFLKIKFENNAFTIDDDTNTALNANLYDGTNFNLVVNGVYTFKFVGVADPAGLLSLTSLYDHTSTETDGRSEYSTGTNSDGDVVITLAPRVLTERVNAATLGGKTINVYSSIPTVYF